jgi:hypothetical protein
MQSNLEKFVKVLVELLRGMWEPLGAFAIVALGMIFVGGIMFSLFAFRWIRHGGLRAGATPGFFAERREVEQWLRRH